MSVPQSLKYDNRVVFRRGKQYEFLQCARTVLRLSWAELADKISIPERTFNDWIREKHSLSYNALQKIHKLSGVKIPDDVKIKSPFWYTSKGGKIAGPLVYKKYGRVGGDQKYRKIKWREWWNKKGKWEKHPIINVAFPVKTPKKSRELAEFIGIMLGDGGITKYQIRIWLNKYTDKPYSFFVKKLLKKLFDIEPNVNIIEKQSVIIITISRTKLTRFCLSLGLKRGNKLKQGLDMPSWVKMNMIYTISCLRGLFDTDGCIFNECHHIKGREYCYPRLCFTSYSNRLLSSVLNALNKLGFSPKIRNRRNVQLENRNDIIRYFQLVGTHNPHYKRRFCLFLEECSELARNWS